MADRVTQVVAEVLQGPGTPNARVTQLVTEALQGPGVPNARMSQLVLEILVPASSGVEASAKNYVLD
jgi:hypothetical protein